MRLKVCVYVCVCVFVCVLKDIGATVLTGRLCLN